MQKLAGRILFIGDNQDICELISKILRRAGCEPLTASSPAEALRLIPKESPDAILIDWVTESDEETELCKQVRAIAPQASVYLFTGIASGSEVKMGMRALAGAHVEPLSVDALVEALFEDGKVMNRRTGKVPVRKLDVVH